MIFLRTHNKFLYPPAAVSSQEQWKLAFDKGHPESRLLRDADFQNFKPRQGRVLEKQDSPTPRSRSVPAKTSSVTRTPTYPLLEQINNAIRKGEPWKVKQYFKKHDLGLSHASRAELIRAARTARRNGTSKTAKPSRQIRLRSASTPNIPLIGSNYERYHKTTTMHIQKGLRLGDAGLYLSLHPKISENVLRDFFRGFSFATLSNAIATGRTHLVRSILKKSKTIRSAEEVDRLIKLANTRKNERIAGQSLHLQKNPIALRRAVQNFHADDRYEPVAIVRAMTKAQVKDSSFTKGLMDLGNSPQEYQAMGEAISKGAQIPENAVHLRLSRSANQNHFAHDLAALHQAGVIAHPLTGIDDYVNHSLDQIYTYQDDPDMAQGVREIHSGNISQALRSLDRRILLSRVPNQEYDILSSVESDEDLLTPAVQKEIQGLRKKSRL